MLSAAISRNAYPANNRAIIRDSFFVALVPYSSHLIDYKKRTHIINHVIDKYGTYDNKPIIEWIMIERK